MRLGRSSGVARSRAFPSVSPRRTTHDARHVEGVFDVIVDDVKVHPPMAHRRPDDEIRAAALQRLTADARIRSTHIHVKVSRGHLTLTGYARHDAGSAAALEDVTSLSGVVGVTNQIKVR
jgi:osmotically-inducible protein OsmY